MCWRLYDQLSYVMVSPCEISREKTGEVMTTKDRVSQCQQAQEGRNCDERLQVISNHRPAAYTVVLHPERHLNGERER